MTMNVKDAAGNVVAIAQPVTGRGPSSAGTLIALPTDHDVSKSADIAALQSNLLTALGLLATDQDVMATNAKLEAIRLLLATPTIASGAATDATLVAIKNALLAQVDFANLIVTDGSGYFVRRETVNQVTGAISVSFTTLAGAAATPNTASLAPVVSAAGGGSGGAGTTRVVETALFDVLTGGAGTSIGDVLARVLVYDVAANSVVGAYWHNLTTGAALATTPASGAIVEQARNPANGAPTAALQTSGNAALAQIDTDLVAGLGADGSSPPTLPGGATGVRGWLRLLASLLPASLGAKTAALSLSIAPATDASFKTAQPDVATSGTLAASTANAAFAVPLANGAAVVAFALPGRTASGATLTAEGSNDGGTTWQAVNLVSKVLGDGVFSPAATLDGNYRVNAGGHTNVRLRVSSAGTGTVTVAALASSQNPLVALSGPVAQTPDQDPIFDHANGKKVSITASAVVFTPAAGCKYARVSCDADVVLNTAGVAAVDDGTSIRLVANAPEVIPVVPGVAVYALSLSGSAAVVRATPMKVRN